MCKSIGDGGKRCKTHISERQVALGIEMQKKIVASMGDTEREKTEKLMKEYGSHVGEGKLVSDTEDKQAKFNALNHPSVISAKKKATKLAEEWDEEDAIIRKMSKPTMNDKISFASRFNDEYKGLQSRSMGAFINMKNAKDPVERKKFEQESVRLEQRARDIAYKTPVMSKSECKEMSQNTKLAKEVQESVKNYNNEHQNTLSYYQNSLLLNKSLPYKNAANNYVNTKEGKALLNKVSENKIQSELSSHNQKKLEERIESLKSSGMNDTETISAKNKLLSAKKNYENLERAYEYKNKHNFLKNHIDENKDIQKDMVLPSVFRGSHDRETKNITVLPQDKFNQISREYSSKNWSKYHNLSSEAKDILVAKDLYKTRGITSLETIKNDKALQHNLLTDSREYNSLIDNNVKIRSDWLANEYN